MAHISVLLQESIEGLEVKPGDVVLDATFGAGGHTRALCEAYGNTIRIIALDQDQDAVERGKKMLSKMDCDVSLSCENFRHIDRVPESNTINAALFDLGTSVDQIKSSGRGFSFQTDEPLLMTLSAEKKDDTVTAEKIVNTWSEETIKTILEAYGDEPFSGRIARAVVEAREKKPILTTFELVQVIKEATPKFYHFKKIHPATRTFQALRIAVNDEFQSLREGLRKTFERLVPGGRIAVISFHSVEDREVKQYFRDLEREGLGKRITKKPIRPGREEILRNPKSRSAKLRIFKKQS